MRVNTKTPSFYGASYLILKQNGKILLLRRAHTGWKDGFYGLPAGHIEGKESVFDALKREVKEEIGISITRKDATLSHIMHRVSDDRRVYFDFFFTAKRWSGKIRNCEPEKHDEVAWFPIKKLPKNLIPYLARVHERIGKNIFFSEDKS